MNTTALDARLLTCSAGAYPWDDWERSALASGLAADLASLGRSVMREAYNHAWCERLKRECGWSDDGRLMLRRVLAQPRRTAARWEWLMLTDGLRFDPWERQEHYEDSPCWGVMRRRWERQQAKARAEAAAVLRDPAVMERAMQELSRFVPGTEQENMEAGFLCLRLRAEASAGAATTNNEPPTTN